MNQYSSDYMLLGIRPGDSLDMLRRAYRAEIRKWHPDRYTRDDIEKQAAEERTKQINRAYRALQDYYELHGALPLDTVTEPAPSPDPVTATPSKDHTNAQETTPQSRRRGAWRHLAIVTMALAALSYYLYAPNGSKPWDAEQRLQPENSSATLPVDPAKTADSVERFAFGSSIGEVYAIQGIPTRIDGDVWYYGDAKVVFKNGKVTHWVDPGNRLRANRDTPFSREEKLLFGRGSTKSEVRAIQGTPLRETDRVWTYGVSEIIFDGDRVIGWHESPLDPLRVRK